MTELLLSRVLYRGALALVGLGALFAVAIAAALAVIVDELHRELCLAATEPSLTTESPGRWRRARQD